MDKIIINLFRVNLKIRPIYKKLKNLESKLLVLKIECVNCKTLKIESIYQSLINPMFLFFVFLFIITPCFYL